MNCTSNDADDMTAPANYDALVRTYQSFVKSIVRQYGFESSTVDDVTQDVFIRLMQNEVLDRYDPTMTFEVKGVSRPCKFRTFLAKTVRQHLRGFLDRERRNAYREVCLIDAQLAGDDNNEATWLDLDVRRAVPGPEDFVPERIDDDKQRAEARAFLKSWPRRNAVDSLDLALFYDAVCAQVDDIDQFQAEPLAEIFGVAPTTVHIWKFELRKVLWNYQTHILGMEIPYPTRRPRRAKAVNQLQHEE